MRPFIRAVAVLLVALAAVPLFAVSRNPVDDVIRMYKSGVPEEAIIQFVQKADNRFDVSADDLIAMADAKIPRTIIKVVLDVSDVRNGRSDVHDSRGPEPSPATMALEGSDVYDYPWYYGYPEYYDPYWYGGFGLGFVAGGPFFGGFHGGGGFRGGHGGGGHGGHGGGGHGGSGHSGGHGGGGHGHH
jgi:hypothetical protein